MNLGHIAEIDGLDIPAVLDKALDLGDSGSGFADEVAVGKR